MSKRSTNRRELRVLGSFRNFAHRQEAWVRFRKSEASALPSKLDLRKSPKLVQLVPRGNSREPPDIVQFWSIVQFGQLKSLSICFFSMVYDWHRVCH
jgi:hypothetical protein